MRPLHIVNLAVNMPGMAARYFVELGEQVIKVEPPEGDPMEQYHTNWYRVMAAGQKILRLDLKAIRDRERLGRLLVNADLLITASGPAAFERLNLDWPTLHKNYPRLCQVAIVGYPPPRPNKVGHDLTYQADFGLFSPPYMACAEETISAALALLLARSHGAQGGYAEVALPTAAAAMAEPRRYWTTTPGANLDGGALDSGADRKSILTNLKKLADLDSSSMLRSTSTATSVPTASALPQPRTAPDR